jgi:hypothetical protein
MPSSSAFDIALPLDPAPRSGIRLKLTPFLRVQGNLDDLLACSNPDNVSLRTDHRITRIRFVLSMGQAF